MNIYKVTWTTYTKNPKFVPGGRAHQEIYTNHTSPIFDNMEEAVAFANQIENSNVMAKTEGKKNFKTIYRVGVLS
jgi:hypothetical protein